MRLLPAGTDMTKGIGIVHTMSLYSIFRQHTYLQYYQRHNIAVKHLCTLNKATNVTVTYCWSQSDFTERMYVHKCRYIHTSVCYLNSLTNVKAQRGQTFLFRRWNLVQIICSVMQKKKTLAPTILVCASQNQWVSEGGKHISINVKTNGISEKH